MCESFSLPHTHTHSLSLGWTSACKMSSTEPEWVVQDFLSFSPLPSRAVPVLDFGVYFLGGGHIVNHPPHTPTTEEKKKNQRHLREKEGTGKGPECLTCRTDSGWRFLRTQVGTKNMEMSDTFSS